MSLIIGPWEGSGDDLPREVRDGGREVVAGWCQQTGFDVLVVDGICSGCAQPVFGVQDGDDDG